MLTASKGAFPAETTITPEYRPVRKVGLVTATFNCGMLVCEECHRCHHQQRIHCNDTTRVMAMVFCSFSAPVLVLLDSCSKYCQASQCPLQNSHPVGVQRFSVENRLSKTQHWDPLDIGVMSNHAQSSSFGPDLFEFCDVKLDQTACDPCLAQETDLWLPAGLAIVCFYGRNPQWMETWSRHRLDS